MTNIIQVQNRLKSVPDETLISEIQKPTGQAPQVLVLNELNRRKNDRAEYARRQEEGPQTTVAEDIVKQPLQLQKEFITAMSGIKAEFKTLLTNPKIS